MNLINGLKYIIKEPNFILYYADKFLKIRISDELYLKIMYKRIFNKELNLENPSTFNEKLQWLKLHDRKPEYTKMVDKYEAKNYIKELLGEQYIIPTIGIYDKFEQIDFNQLPNQFVMKCTHDSGSTIVCKDKSKFNKANAKKKMKKALKTNFFYQGREWPYKNVKPRILVEKYMQDYTGALVDYKFYAFNGKCEYVMACIDREKENEKTKFIYYDKNWNIKKEFSDDGIKYGDKVLLKRPKNLDKMFEFASILSKGINFVRVDFYEIDSKLYFGELTFYPSSGFDDKRRNEIATYLNTNLKIGEDKNENSYIRSR